MEQTPASDERDGPAVTVSITRRVHPGREPAFEAWLAGITEAASRFPGFLGTRVVRPIQGNPEYRVVVRFAAESDLRRWEDSEERRAWYARSEALIEGAPAITDITGTAQERSLALALSPLNNFVRTSVSGIGLLLLGTVAALVLANSPLAMGYERFWETELSIGVAGVLQISESLRHWVSDGLMTLFFFIAGLEIKRELLVGDLRSPRQAALPIAAALGGSLVPALAYPAINMGGTVPRAGGSPWPPTLRSLWGS